MSDNYESDIIKNITDKICKESVEIYDDILQKALLPYGITKENVKENLDRVIVEKFEHGCIPGIFRDDYYIDGKYAFSILKKSRFNCDDAGNFCFKYSYALIRR